MIRILLRSNTRNILTDSVDASQLSTLIADRTNLVWVDMLNDGSDERAEIERLLLDVFKFHPLAVEDAMIESHVPKVDDWSDYLYIVLHAIHIDRDKQEIGTDEVDIFVGQNYLVTHRERAIDAIDRLWRNGLRDERHTRRGPDYLLYELSDGIAADYMPTIDRIDEIIDQVQAEVIDKPDTHLLGRILKLKSAVLDLRRVLSPQREVFNKLARDDYSQIDPKDRVYFRDVYDHFVRLVDLNESLRDLVAGSVDTYLSVTSNHTNDIVKALTIVTVLFMPLTFITGFFGMNFFGGNTEVIFPLNPVVAFIVCVSSMVLLPLIMVLYIRRRGWW